MSEPESLEALVKHARWTRDALAKATDPPPAPPPDGETAAQALTRRWTEQHAAELADEALEQRVRFANPTAPTAADLGDPLRAFARDERARRGRRRHRGLIP